jgi:hypothetical protein
LPAQEAQQFVQDAEHPPLAGLDLLDLTLPVGRQFTHVGAGLALRPDVDAADRRQSDLQHPRVSALGLAPLWGQALDDHRKVDLMANKHIHAGCPHLAIAIGGSQGDHMGATR